MAKLNLSRYQELLAKTNSSTNRNKNFFDDPIFIELISLELIVETQVLYNHKNSYFALIQNRLNEVVSRGEAAKRASEYIIKKDNRSNNDI
jgi:hypothetical protein